MPGFGRGGMLPGLPPDGRRSPGAPPWRGPGAGLLSPGRAARSPPCAGPGRGPDGRDGGAPAPTPNGLLPTRGGRGPGLGDWVLGGTTECPGCEVSGVVAGRGSDLGAAGGAAEAAAGAGTSGALGATGSATTGLGAGFGAGGLGAAAAGFSATGCGAGATAGCGGAAGAGWAGAGAGAGAGAAAFLTGAARTTPASLAPSPLPG